MDFDQAYTPPLYVGSIRGKNMIVIKDVHSINECNFKLLWNTLFHPPPSPPHFTFKFMNTQLRAVIKPSLTLHPVDVPSSWIRRSARRSCLHVDSRLVNYGGQYLPFFFLLLLLGSPYNHYQYAWTCRRDCRFYWPRKLYTF